VYCGLLQAKAVCGRPVASTRTAAPSIGEGRLDNLVIIAVVLVALAQILTILLTIRRERDIKELGRLVDEQRLHIQQLRVLLASRTAAQPGMKSEREAIGERKRIALGPP
jgi:hypothetical protein